MGRHLEATESAFEGDEPSQQENDKLAGQLKQAP